MLPFDPIWVGETWEGIFGRLEEMDWRGCVVGDHGSGKTTFLEALADRLVAQGIPVANVFINRETRSSDVLRSLSGIREGEVVLFDGAELLGPIRWRRFLRTAEGVRGLVITAHGNRGRLPTLLKVKATPEILLRCIRILDPQFPIDHQEAGDLLKRYGGNIREALLECYDRSSSG